MEKIIRRINCDECGKETILDKWYTPYNWFRMEKLAIFYRKTSKKYIGKKNKLYIDESVDPHFCCKDCAMKWFEKQLNKISK